MLIASVLYLISLLTLSVLQITVGVPGIEYWMSGTAGIYAFYLVAKMGV